MAWRGRLRPAPGAGRRVVRQVAERITLAAVAITAALALGLAYVADALLPAEQELAAPAPPAPAAGDAAPPAPRTLPAVAALAAQPLFGRYVPEPQPPQALPPTPLQLRLHAVFTHERPEATYAVIAAPGVKPTAYAAGDALPGGAMLQELSADHVVMLRDGRLETLTFASAQAAAERVQATAGTAASASVPPAAAAASHDGPAMAASPPSASDAQVRLRLAERLEALRRHAGTPARGTE